MTDSSLLPSPSSLSDRDREVLALLGREPEGQVTFQGMRRLLDIHQESLSRALRRLREDGFVVGTETGYRLSSLGQAVARSLVGGDGRPALPVLRTVLPGRYQAWRAAEALQGRWFGPLRWFGHRREPEAWTLSWTTEDGGVRLDARFEGVLLAVDARVTGPARLPEAIHAAHRLLYEVNRAYLEGGIPSLPRSNS